MSVIDQKQLDQLAELIGGDPVELVALMESFVQEGGAITAAMSEAVDATDLDALRRGAHSLKSSSLDFGAVELSERCSVLEASCRLGWPEDASGQVKDITQAFDLARTEIGLLVAELTKQGSNGA